MPEVVDWYERRHELDEGMVFNSCYGVVKLDRGVPGDGTKWYVQSWYPGRPEVPGYERGHWSCDDATIEPGDLTELVADPQTGRLHDFATIDARHPWRRK